MEELTMRRRFTHRAFLPALLPLALAAAALGCGSDTDDACPRGRGIQGAVALDASRVEVTFACRIDAASAALAEHYRVENVTVDPTEALAVASALVTSERVVVLTTAPQTGGVTYTLWVEGVKDAAGNVMAATRNFAGSGGANTAPVTFRFDDSAGKTAARVTLLLSVNVATGAFDPGKNTFELLDADGDHIWEGVLSVAVDPARTAATSDDSQGPAKVGYSARAVDGAGKALSALAAFEVKDASAQTVILLPPGAVKPNPGGSVTVTFRVDDRPALALSAPSLVGSFDAEGNFDSSFPTTITLSDDDNDHVWEGQATVKVDPNRTVGGQDPNSLAYSVLLVAGGEQHNGRYVEFAVADDQTPLTVDLLMGNPDKVPVTFRVDVASAWLTPDGRKRGLYPNEAVFLTGEFGLAEDAFGNNAADAFAGGENVVLQMNERTDHPGVWERTIFLRKNRPAGWKVVRCPKDKGCSELNKMVKSSGRAFPTVMKNLVTELCDLAKTSWPDDPDCGAPVLIDPRKLNEVTVGAGTLDYSAARIFEGTGAGMADQKDPPNTPAVTLMFKQEAPDLVVRVGEEKLATPVYVVGTWRDVNIAGTPEDLAKSGTIVDLADTDYDAGMIGGLPINYQIDEQQPPPPPPPPVSFALDGSLDSAAKQVAGDASSMKIYAAYSKGLLYLATDDAGEGSDNFIILSATGSGTPVAAPWGKGGTIAFGGKTIFVADENDNAYAGVFEHGAAQDTLIVDASTSTKTLGVATGANGGVVEAVLDLKQIFGTLPTTVWVVAGPWQNDSGGALYAPALAAKQNNGDGNVDADELVELVLADIEVK